MERREKYSKIVIFLFVIFFVWVLLQFMAPLLLPANSVEDLSGLVALSDNENMIRNMSFPWDFIYSAGDSLCHQKAERAFFLNGNQMPFCSRCTAIWLGLAVGLFLMIFYRIQLDGRFLFLMLLCISPLALDGAGQLFGFWESTNFVRFFTGMLTGFICGVAIGVIIDEVKGVPVVKK
jgi:uncharacterized membrane protein